MGTFGDGISGWSGELGMGGKLSIFEVLWVNFITMNYLCLIS